MMGDGGLKGGEKPPINKDTMRMFEAFNLFMQQQQFEQQREALARKALHFVVNKLDQFDG